MSGYLVALVFVFTVLLSTLVWNFAPKQNQTVWRSSVILGLAMCYLMWAITYLAQLHPLEAPRRSNLRPEKISKIAAENRISKIAIAKYLTE